MKANETTQGNAEGFQFITTVNTIGYDKETGRRVRSHVSRRPIAKGGLRKPQPLPDATQWEQSSRFKVTTCGKGTTKYLNHGSSPVQERGSLPQPEEPPAESSLTHK
jgi:hypothetical protein